MPYLRRLPSGKWQATYRDDTGTRHSLTRPTKTQAREEALEQEAQLRRGTWHDPARGLISIREWHDEWAPARQLAPTTKKRDDGILTNHVLKKWEATPLNKVTRLAVQRWITQMGENGVGVAVIRTGHNLLCQMLDAAVDDDRIPPSVARKARKVRLPRPVEKRVRILTADERTQLVTSLTDEPDKRLVLTALGTGLRWGELTALRTDAIDLGGRRLHVSVTHSRQGFGPPKTASSVRWVPISTHVAEILDKQMVECEPGDLVFSVAGEPIDYNNWRSRVWVAATRRLAKPRPTFHDLRHTYASDLIAAGVDLRTVQDLLGHSSMRMLQRYAHQVPSATDKARRVLEDLDRMV